jgi:hypothetical protein
LEIATSHRLVGQRDVLHLPSEEPGPALDAGLGGVAPAALAHLLQHVQADGPALGSDPSGGQDGVDAPTRADIQHDLAGLEPGIADGIAHPQGPLDGPRGNLGEFLVAVQLPGHGLAGAGGDSGIGLLDGVLDLLLEHQVPTHRSS